MPADVHTIELSLARESYPVLAGGGLLPRTGDLVRKHLPATGRRVAIVTDSNVGPLYESTIAESLRREGFDPVTITVAAGEASKSMEEVTSICREMIRAGLDRKSWLVALGGGVVGDLAGFAAAIFQRGIPCVQLPTTIVSQVDSSVGGKTGVNTPEGKNLIGAFHQPRLVLADTDTLATLPGREYREGFAEVIKHAAIRDSELLDQVACPETVRTRLPAIIARNISIKAAVVEEDERETTGTRALLNFGHTIGHAIESAGGYGRFLHGEAISLGLVAALRLSETVAGLESADSRRIIECLHAWELPTRLPSDLATTSILEAMKRDKKFEAGQIRFVVIDRIGHAFVSGDVTVEQIETEVERLREA